MLLSEFNDKIEKYKKRIKKDLKEDNLRVTSFSGEHLTIGFLSQYVTVTVWYTYQGKAKDGRRGGHMNKTIEIKV